MGCVVVCKSRVWDKFYARRVDELSWVDWVTVNFLRRCDMRNRDVLYFFMRFFSSFLVSRWKSESETESWISSAIAGDRNLDESGTLSRFGLRDGLGMAVECKVNRMAARRRKRRTEKCACQVSSKCHSWSLFYSLPPIPTFQSGWFVTSTHLST